MRTILVLVMLALAGCVAPAVEPTTDAPVQEPVADPIPIETPPPAPEPVVEPEPQPEPEPETAPALTAVIANATLTGPAGPFKAGDTATYTLSVDFNTTGTYTWKILNRSAAIEGNSATITFNDTRDDVEFQVTGQNTITNTTSVEVWGLRPAWFDEEPTSEMLIRPGVISSACTTNFLYTYQYERFFLGTAAHCIDDDTGVTDNTCGGHTKPTGSPERFFHRGSSWTVPAKIAFSSWLSMQEAGWNSDTHLSECKGNDFGLIEVLEEHWPIMHPKGFGIIGHVTGMTDCRGWGGSLNSPESIPVKAYGRSSLRADRGPESPQNNKEGYYIYEDGSGYQCTYYLLTPGIPGDSGGPLADMEGRALGVASTVALAPDTGSNDYTNIAAALETMLALDGWVVDIVTSA